MADLPKISKEEAEAITRAGWYLPEDADYIGGGGGGAAYLCLNLPFVNAIKNGIEMKGAGNTALEASKAITKGIAKNFVWENTGCAVAKIQHKIEPRTEREIAAMREVTHPNLMKIFAHDSSARPRWMIMEYHPGGTLEDRAAPYVGQPLRTFEALLPIAEALAKLHGKNLFHRDIKPKNIFIARGGRLVLGDLGVVFDPKAERLTEGDPPLSRDWIPPWHPDDGYDAKWDLFMLARTAMSLIAGSKLKQNAWLSRKEFHLPNRFPDVPGIQAVQDFFKKAFVDDKDAFPWKSAGEYIQELRDLVDVLSGRVIPRLAWCVWAMDKQVRGGSDIFGVPLLVQQPIRRLRARAMASRGPKVGLQLVTADNSTIVAETEIIQVTTGDKVMTPDLVLTPKARLESGWYRFNVRVHGSGDTYIEGLTVYAE